MANYTYGPPPPAPPPAQQQAPTGYYSQPYQQQGSHGGGGRGGHAQPGRGNFHGYNYSAQPQPQYGPNQPQHAGYGPPQWQQNQPPTHAPHPPPVALPAQNYHPNYAPQMYQQQNSYSQQPAYQPPAQGYNQHQYPQPAQPSAPEQQSWGPPSHGPSASHGPQGGPQGGPQNGPQFGGGRGRMGHHNDRGGPKAPMMGPPMRWGFDQSSNPNPAAPVSNQYPPQQFGPPQAGSAPYGAGPYQGYTGPPHAGGPPSHGSFNQGRGGFHHNSARGGGRFGDKRGTKRHGGPSNNVSVPNTHHQKPDAASSGKKKKRKTNTLGLTPGDESDEEDDADEEIRLAELYLADAPQPENISTWIAERRQNFPTQARAKAKQASASNGDKAKNESSKDSAASLAKQQQKAEKLRKQLEKVESSIKRKREQQDEGDDMRGVDRSTSVSSDDKSDDEGPETLPSRPTTTNVPPPARKADPTKHCKYFSTGGVCGKKNKCRFVHDETVRQAALQAREMNGGRMTLQQRLVLNDKDQEDLTIVKTLQYLKEKGAMASAKSSNPSDGSAVNGTSAQPKTAATQSHLPPPPVQSAAKDVKMANPANLPPQPPPSSSDPKYAGWNMRGFGNTGVKPGDL